MKNVLIAGANGQLGNEMRLLAEKNTGYHYYFTDVAELDICDEKAVAAYIEEHLIDIVVNCAAYTNVEAAEHNELLAEKLNAEAPKNLAQAIKEVHGWLVHISTDYVFGKEPYNIPCKEDQLGTPTGVYGHTK